MAASISPQTFVVDPQDPDLVAGLESYDAHEWVLAEPPLRVAADRGNITAIFKLANTVDHLGRETEAVELWQLASAQGHDGASNNLALRFKKQGRIDEAIALHERSALLGNREAMFNLGVSLNETGRQDGAREWLERAIEVGNGRAAAYLGRMLITRGQREEGLTVLAHGVELGNSSAALMLAVDAEERDDYDAIVRWSSRALAMPEDPNEAHQVVNALGLLGYGLFMTGREGEAIEPLERAVAMGNEPARTILENARELLRASSSTTSSIRHTKPVAWSYSDSSATVPKRFCGSCGERTMLDARFCGNCGAKV